MLPVSSVANNKFTYCRVPAQEGNLFAPQKERESGGPLRPRPHFFGKEEAKCSSGSRQKKSRAPAIDRLSGADVPALAERLRDFIVSRRLNFTSLPRWWRGNKAGDRFTLPPPFSRLVFFFLSSRVCFLFYDVHFRDSSRQLVLFSSWRPALR